MNTRFFPASGLFAVLGAAAILLIGAFAHFDSAANVPQAGTSASPLAAQDASPAEPPPEPPAPAKLSPGMSEIIKLAQAHVDESLILAYITHSHTAFAPTADEIVYLSEMGLSKDVVGALVTPPSAAPVAQPSPQPIAAAPPADAAQPEDNSATGVFYNELAPYGAWSQQPDYGAVWQPAPNLISADWTPYVDGGQWLYSDSGWYWQSSYDWGWAVFHYGRWANVPRKGWVWQPGNAWSPAWVAWRSSSSYIGWAPLPPGVSLNVLAQLTYNSKPVKPNATLGLSPSSYTFVAVSNLTSRNLPRRVMPAPRVRSLVEASDPIQNPYQIIDNRIFNSGPSPKVVAAARHRPVPQVALRATSKPNDAGMADDRRTLAVYVPPSVSAGANDTQSSQKSRLQPRQDPAMLAENDAAAGNSYLSSATPDGVSIQLPPLHPAPEQREGSRGYPTAQMRFPATPAPRVEGFNPAPRQFEPPRVNAESRPAPVENHFPPVEPPRAAPAPPVASSSSNSSKPGK